MIFTLVVTALIVGVFIGMFLGRPPPSPTEVDSAWVAKVFRDAKREHEEKNR